MNIATLSTVLNAVAILVFGLIWLGIVIALRVKEKQSFVYLLFFTIFYVYLCEVLNITEFQFQSLLLLNYLSPGHLMLRGVGNNLNLIPLITLMLEDFKTSMLNVLMMVPFGFGLPFITNFRMRKVVVVGALFSVFIEFLQLVTGLLGKSTFRIADINDVIFNTIGVATGYLLFVGFISIYRRAYRNWGLPANSLLRYIALRPQVDKRSRLTLKTVIATVCIVLAVASATLYGHGVYANSHPQPDMGAGSDAQEGTASRAGDLCNGTGGNGQIVSMGNDYFTMKQNDKDADQIVHLSAQTEIKTSTGLASISYLKTGDRVTLVGGPNPDGSFTADAVVVCGATGS